MSDKRSIITQHPITAQTPPSLDLPKPHWDVNKFEGLIYNMGYDAYIEKALRCPCCDKATGQALSTCHNCLGRGWFFVDKRQTRIVAQSMENLRRNSQTGEINHGTARITARASDKLGFMDRVMLLDLTAWYTELLNPIEYEDELIAYPVYEPLEISNIYLYGGDNVKLIPLTPSQYNISGNKIIFDKSLEELVPVEDMNQKFPEMTISIRYSYHPVYHIIDANRELTKVREKGCFFSDDNLRQVPMLYIGRKAHYIFDAQRFNNNAFENTVIE